MIENLFGGGGGGGTVDTITAGTGISVNSTDPANPIITNTSLNTDETAKVSSNDTTAGYLNGKLVAGSGIALTENSDGGNETLTIANTAPGETTYTTTISDAENTTSLVTLAEFTVPANTWADGETIHLDCLFTVDNNSGSSANITYRVGGTTLTDFTNPNLGYSSGLGAKRTFVKLRFARVGSGVVYEAFTAHNVVSSYVGAIPPFFGGGSVPSIDTSVTFTSNITLYFKIQFSIANASLYCRTENARAFKVPAGTV